MRSCIMGGEGIVWNSCISFTRECLIMGGDGTCGVISSPSPSRARCNALADAAEIEPVCDTIRHLSFSCIVALRSSRMDIPYVLDAKTSSGEDRTMSDCDRRCICSFRSL